MIPQKRYKPHTTSERRRYIEEVQLEPSILFNSIDQDLVGITLEDAVSGKFGALDGRDDAMFVACGPSISVRLNVSTDSFSLFFLPNNDGFLVAGI
jgi:hypothetical protein